MKSPLTVALAVCLTLFGVASGAARPIADARPESQGMSSERLARIATMAEGFVARGEFTGVLTLVARNGRIVHFHRAGTRGLDSSDPLREDDLYRIFSMTKPIVAVAAMILYERGEFQLSDPVSRFIPELKDRQVWTEGGLVPARHEPTMGELLTHTAGFGYGLFPQHPTERLYAEAQLFQVDGSDEYVNKVAELPLRFQPGERWHYSIASDLVGVAVERISGQTLAQFFRAELFEPLGMSDTFFEVPEHKRSRFLANSVWDAESGAAQPIPSSRDFRYRDVQFFSGGGGLVSTTRDYLRFAEMLRRGGELNGVRVLSPKTIALIMADHLPRLLPPRNDGGLPGITLLPSARDTGFGIGGAVTRGPAASGTLNAAGVYTWGGAAGTVFWIDPVEEIVVLAMVQQMRSPHPLREQMTTLVNQAITESYAR